MIRLLFILSFYLSANWAASQAQFKSEFMARDSLINDAMKAEAYLKAIELIEDQFLLIDSSELYDSLYKYCYNFGRAWWKIGGREKGIDAAKQISAEVKKKDTDIIHYLQTLNDLSWLYYETGNIRQCLITDSTYLSICLETEGIPVDKLNIAYYNLGFDYLETGQNQKALDHFQSSVDVILESGQKLDKALSKSYNALGAVQWHLGLLEQAKRSYEASLALIEKETDPVSMLEQGNILGNMALIMQDNGEIIKAKEYQEHFIRIDSEALPLVEDAYMKETALRRMSSAYINLADIYFSLGDYEKSRKLVELAIEERKKLLEPDDPSLASAIEHLAYLEMQSGNLVEAEKKFKDYLAYCQQYFGENNAKTAWAYKDLGMLYQRKREYDLSESFYNKAITSQKKAGNPQTDPYLAKIYRERSSLYATINNIEKAQLDLSKSKQIWLQSHEEDNLNIVGIYLEMAELKIKEGNYSEAGMEIDQSLEVLKSKNVRSPQIMLLLPRAFYLKAIVEIAEKPDIVSFSSALNNLEEAIKYLKTGKQSFLDEESKVKLYDAHKKIFESAIDATYSLFDLTRDEKWIETFFRLTEENRTILLRNQLQHFSALDYKGVPDSILEQERALIAQLRNEDLESMKNIVELERKYLILVEEIKEKYPEYYALKYYDKTITISEVQNQLLSKENTLLTYSITSDFVYALLIDQQFSRLFRFPVDGLKTKINNLNDAIIRNDIKGIENSSKSISQSIFAPLQASINHDGLIIIPDQDLFFLNFEILPNLSKQSDNKDDVPLMYNYTISYLLSATVALQFNDLQENKPRQVLTFAPGFSDRQKMVYRQSVEDTGQVDKKYMNYLQQPFAVKTAQQIAGVFSGDAFLEDQADETTFKKESAKYGILHLGTHAEVNENAPLMSHLVLSKNIDNDSLDDGYLHAYEIYQMPLHAELAVLTACKTGVGKHQNSEGVISLAHSFSYAGCPSIVMSLWNIDEKSSAGIIHDFYYYLSTGMTKSKALRQAKLDYLAGAPTEMQSPYYWAGLVLLGDESPVDMQSRVNWKNIILVAVVLFLLLSLIMYRRIN